MALEQGEAARAQCVAERDALFQVRVGVGLGLAVGLERSDHVGGELNSAQGGVVRGHPRGAQHAAHGVEMEDPPEGGVLGLGMGLGLGSWLELGVGVGIGVAIGVGVGVAVGLGGVTLARAAAAPCHRTQRRRC